jgi:hypothetical protein
MKFKIHFEFRASLRKFQDLNFWDATSPPDAVDWDGGIRQLGRASEARAVGKSSSHYIV